MATATRTRRPYWIWLLIGGFLAFAIGGIGTYLSYSQVEREEQVVPFNLEVEDIARVIVGGPTVLNSSLEQLQRDLKETQGGSSRVSAESLVTFFLLWKKTSSADESIINKTLLTQCPSQLFGACPRNVYWTKALGGTALLTYTTAQYTPPPPSLPRSSLPADRVGVFKATTDKGVVFFNESWGPKAQMAFKISAAVGIVGIVSLLIALFLAPTKQAPAPARKRHTTVT